ncbi:hypothetical protein MN116_004205 [Schistosoma mekongi]|uniref:Uncharacterized protein n=1 Tax=Schistosoma mekongi TaxID=38744 RepID=A0AAE1ZGK3_SCHME|nr:hypothetical protein MN116_004205 [Schistosoma mekongi]
MHNLFSYFENLSSMQRRPLTRIELGLQDLMEFKNYIDTQCNGDCVKVSKNVKESLEKVQLREAERRKKNVRHRIGSILNVLLTKNACLLLGNLLEFINSGYS